MTKLIMRNCEDGQYYTFDTFEDFANWFNMQGSEFNALTWEAIQWNAGNAQKPKWEVQEFTLCDGWVNTWCDEDEVPTLFDSREEAEAELQAFLKDMREAVERGDMEDAPTEDSYQIVEV